MQRILFLLLAAPFWLQFVFAGGLVYFGYTSQQSAQIRYATQAELLQSAPPETIVIGDFAAKYDRKAPQEVSVTAQLALDHNTRLIRKTNFITTGEDLLYVLVDPEAPAGETVARGAIVIDPDEQERFTDWAMENMTTFGGSGPVVQIDGLLSGGTQNSMVVDALKEQGMTKGPNFFYITPYLEGREAALTLKPNDGLTHAMPIYYGALFFALLGFAKLIYKRHASSKPARPQVSALGSDLRSTIQHGTPILRPENPDLVEKFIYDHATLARIEAAMANPKIAVRDIGQAVPAPKVAPEMFTVPDPVYAPRAGSSAIVSTPTLAERLRSAVTSSRAPQIVAYAGLAALLLVITAMMVGQPGSIGQMPSVEGNIAVGKSLLPWIGGLIVVLVVFKGVRNANPVSSRKEIYAPYIRLAERERTYQDGTGQR
jgi:hypothetical protein